MKPAGTHCQGLLHTFTTGKRATSYELSHPCEGRNKAQTDWKSQTLLKEKESHLCKGDLEPHADIAIASSSPELTKGHMVHAVINGKPVQLLLDTGSVVTLLGLDTWTRCKSDSDKL